MGLKCSILCVGSILPLLAGCAGSFDKDLRGPNVSRCYETDSTRNVGKADYAAMFEGIQKREAGSDFRPCDTSQTSDVKIKPVNSSDVRPNKTFSYVALGFDLTTLGVGFGWAAAADNDLFLLIAGTQMEPVERIDYAIRHKNKRGFYQIDTLHVEDQIWFASEERAKRLMLDASQKEIRRHLFNDSGADLKPDGNRLSLAVGQLIHAKQVGGWYVVPRYERLLPYEFSLDIAPGAFAPFSGDVRYYSLQAGPRWYFLSDLLGGRHSGLFVGTSAYLQYKYDQIRYANLGLPVTYGCVWQGKWISVDLDWGLGPDYEWVEKNAYGIHSRFRSVYLGNLSIGHAF